MSPHVCKKETIELVTFVKKIIKYDKRGKNPLWCLVVATQEKLHFEKWPTILFFLLVATQKNNILHQKEDPKELQKTETKNK